MTPPYVATIVIIVIVVFNNGGGMGADNQRPPPHAPDRWPTDDVRTVAVGFPPVNRSPAQPRPILHVMEFVIVFVIVVVFFPSPSLERWGWRQGFYL